MQCLYTTYYTQKLKLLLEKIEKARFIFLGLYFLAIVLQYKTVKINLNK